MRKGYVRFKNRKYSRRTANVRGGMQGNVCWKKEVGSVGVFLESPCWENGNDAEGLHTQKAGAAATASCPQIPFFSEHWGVKRMEKGEGHYFFNEGENVFWKSWLLPHLHVSNFAVSAILQGTPTELCFCVIAVLFINSWSWMVKIGKGDDGNNILIILCIFSVYSCSSLFQKIRSIISISMDMNDPC